MGCSDEINWVTEQLAGLPQPGLAGDLEADLAALQSQGVGLLVTLTSQVVLTAAYQQRFGIEGLHFPIAAFSVPEPEACAALCERVELRLRAGGKVAFHCFAGQGRTGTMLACCLVWQGAPAADAIRRVRLAIPKAIETDEQAEFVHRMALLRADAK